LLLGYPCTLCECATALGACVRGLALCCPTVGPRSPCADISTQGWFNMPSAALYNLVGNVQGLPQMLTNGMSTDAVIQPGTYAVSAGAVITRCGRGCADKLASTRLLRRCRAQFFYSYLSLPARSTIYLLVQNWVGDANLWVGIGGNRTGFTGFPRSVRAA